MMIIIVLDPKYIFVVTNLLLNLRSIFLNKSICYIHCITMFYAIISRSEFHLSSDKRDACES